MSKTGTQSVLAGGPLAGLSCGVRELSLEETEAFRDAWRRVYARPLKRAHGVWHRGKYDWHVFSFGDTFALERDDARRAYSGQARSELVIIPNDKKISGCRTEAIAPPSLDGEADIYISPPDLSWTMVYTHEDGWCGPYFSRAEWVDRPPRMAPSTAAKESKKGHRRRK